MSGTQVRLGAALLFTLSMLGYVFLAAETSMRTLPVSGNAIGDFSRSSGPEPTRLALSEAALGRKSGSEVVSTADTLGEEVRLNSEFDSVVESPCDHVHDFFRPSPSRNEPCTKIQVVFSQAGLIYQSNFDQTNTVSNKELVILKTEDCIDACVAEGGGDRARETSLYQPNNTVFDALSPASDATYFSDQATVVVQGPSGVVMNN